jgi:hypothetical protein
MKRTLLFLALLANSPISCLPQPQEDSKWDKYLPRTIQSIMDAHSAAITEFGAEPAEKNHVFLTADSFPSRVRLEYLGKSRPLVDKRQLLVSFWAKMMKRPEDTVNIFGTEMLFREGDKDLWIAVQRPLVDPLPKEVPLARKFTAYVMWMGAIKSGEHWEWVFAMNEFDTPPDGSLPKPDQK